MFDTFITLKNKAGEVLAETRIVAEYVPSEGRHVVTGHQDNRPFISARASVGSEMVFIFSKANDGVDVADIKRFCEWMHAISEAVDNAKSDIMGPRG